MCIKFGVSSASRFHFRVLTYTETDIHEVTDDHRTRASVTAGVGKLLLY